MPTSTPGGWEKAAQCVMVVRPISPLTRFMLNSTVSSQSARRRDLLPKGGPWLALAIAALVSLGLSAAPQPAAPAAKAETVGSATCQSCHEDVSKAFQMNPHAAVDKDAKRGWQGKACEACHGP